MEPSNFRRKNVGLRLLAILMCCGRWTECAASSGDSSSVQHLLADSFREELLITPLDTEHLHLQFKFTITTPRRAHYGHVDLFPKSVADVMEKHALEELHLVLTQGLYRHRQWGYAAEAWAPTGAQVYAWFSPDDTSTPFSSAASQHSVDQRWKGLTNSLAGLFCATLNDVTNAKSISPVWQFRPQGLTRAGSVNNSLVRYSTLPRENVCTENLTPWKKLLPCGEQSGLARLLNAIKLLSSHYFSLALNVRPVCNNDNRKSCAVEEQLLQATFTATAVIQPGSVQDFNKLHWSLKDIFEVELERGCPLADQSLIYVDQGLPGSPMQEMALQPFPSFTMALPENNHRLAVYDLANSTTFNGPKFTLSGKSPSTVQPGLHEPLLTTHRFVAGYGQHKGAIKCRLENHDPTSALRVQYLEVLPWFLRVYLHTLRLSVPILRSHFRPARDRIAPHHIELLFDIPSASSIEFAVEFDLTLLKWTEYPPDAHRGFDVPPAVVAVMLKSPEQCSHVTMMPGFDSCFLRLYTEALLVNLPTPDFSMPYNVICMTCTVLALAFGPIHAYTSKSLVVGEKESAQRPLVKLKNKVKALIAKWKARRTRVAVPDSTSSAEQDSSPTS
ncbi:hypothetical protein RvY_03955 [Ramazzottius varieornatus]|uniref:GPI transamidase component PIG-T n=1 Tax=Ramazzottius varieornatus TaxID=947166 RepID=A0A1D1UPV9_RAMVA|nr:hypothetical protein RvY_03955 [Ramazzottius varieornatus]